MPRKPPAKQPKAATAPPQSSAAGELPPFYWKSKTLSEMSAGEWEALCDGCGQCCLLKLEDEDTGRIAVTRLACRLLDIGSCRCSNYANRRAHVPDCVKLEPHSLPSISWLPRTCAYRLVEERRDLLWWHPLVSESASSVHEAGVSVRTFARSEAGIPVESYPSHIAHWIEPERR